jgi:hypothetical protein
MREWQLSIEEVFLLTGAMFAFVAAYSWTNRDVFARRLRERFEKVGWTWFARISTDKVFRRVGTFYVIAFGALGVGLLATGIVLLFIPG